MRRSSTGSDRHSCASTATTGPASTLAAGLEQAVGRVGAAVQDQVLDDLAQVRAGCRRTASARRVHDRHVEPGVDRVVEEHGVDRLAHAVWPRNAKLRFERPPDTSAPGQASCSRRVASMNATP